LAQREAVKILAGISLRLSDNYQLSVIIGGENDSASLFAGDAKTRLKPSGSFVIKSRVLTADVAKAVLSEICDDLAKSPFIKMGAAVALTESKMRGTLIAYALADYFSVGVAYFVIFFSRFVVNVDLPADTAGVAATVCNAFKALIIERG
jgi:hypothetical protein